MLQMIYDFFVTFFALENVTPETAAFLEFFVLVASLFFAASLLFFLYKLVKTLFLYLFHMGW